MSSSLKHLKVVGHGISPSWQPYQERTLAQDKEEEMRSEESDEPKKKKKEKKEEVESSKKKKTQCPW